MDHCNLFPGDRLSKALVYNAFPLRFPLSCLDSTASRRRRGRGAQLDRKFAFSASRRQLRAWPGGGGGGVRRWTGSLLSTLLAVNFGLGPEDSDKTLSYPSYSHRQFKGLYLMPQIASISETALPLVRLNATCSAQAVFQKRYFRRNTACATIRVLTSQILMKKAVLWLLRL